MVAQLWNQGPNNSFVFKSTDSIARLSSIGNALLLTFPKTNIFAEKWLLEDHFPFGFRPILG